MLSQICVFDVAVCKHLSSVRHRSVTIAVVCPANLLKQTFSALAIAMPPSKFET